MFGRGNESCRKPAITTSSFLDLRIWAEKEIKLSEKSHGWSSIRDPGSPNTDRLVW